MHVQSTTVGNSSFILMKTHVPDRVLVVNLVLVFVRFVRVIFVRAGRVTLLSICSLPSTCSVHFVYINMNINFNATSLIRYV